MTSVIWWRVLGVLALSLIATWLILLVAVALASRRADRGVLREAARVLPDIIGLLRRLVADPLVGPRVRTRLLLTIGYLLMPIDLIPDFIPVLGWADDVLVVVLVLRSVVRRCGADVLDRHWPGSPQGLAMLARLAGLPADRGRPM